MARRAKWQKSSVEWDAAEHRLPNHSRRSVELHRLGMASRNDDVSPSIPSAGDRCWRRCIHPTETRLALSALRIQPRKRLGQQADRQ